MLVPIKALCEGCNKPFEEGQQHVAATVTGTVVIKQCGEAYIGIDDKCGSAFCMTCEEKFGL